MFWMDWNAPARKSGTEFDSVKSQDLTNPVSMALMSCDSTVTDCPHKTLYSLPGLFAQKGFGACCHRGNSSICAKWHHLKINNGIVALPCSIGKLSINGYGQLHFQVRLLFSLIPSAVLLSNKLFVYIGRVTAWKRVNYVPYVIFFKG